MTSKGQRGGVQGRRVALQAVGGWLLGGFGWATGASAQSLYRSEDAPLAAPTPTQRLEAARADLRTAADRFAASHVRAGRPRAVLYWNRELDDRTHAVRDEGLVMREAVRSSTSSANRPGVQMQREGEVFIGERRLVEPLAPTRRIALLEREEAWVRQAFVVALQRGGLELVDRSLALRSAAASADGRRVVDERLLEMDAVQARARWLLEVLVLPDPTSPTGHGLELRVKDLGRSEVIAQAYADGSVLAPSDADALRWVAAPEGYQPAPGRVRAHFEALGTEAAWRLMEGLTLRLP